MRFVRFAIAIVVGSVVPAAAMTLTSPDIRQGATISKEQVYTRCGGGNISPALSWNGAPANTKSFAITAIDISVKPHYWSHWIAVDLPPNRMSLAKGAALPSGAKPVMTDFGDAAYGGPCPPEGSGPHQYVFTVWAMPNANFQPPANANAEELDAALSKAALAKASITAVYER